MHRTSRRPVPASLPVLLAAVLMLAAAGCGNGPEDGPPFRRAAGADLPRDGLTYGGVLLDLDGDGWRDLLLSRHGDRAEAFLNRGGLRFAPLPAEGALPGDLRDQHGMAACDFDGDGDEDVYISLGAEHGTELSYNQLWVQDGPGRFRKVGADNLLLADPVGRGRGALWAELDGDRHPELLLIGYRSPARLLSWTGDAWRDVTERLPYPPPIPLWEPGWPPPTAEERERSLWIHAAVVHDLDGDGRPDLLAIGRPGWSGLWLNAGGGRLQDRTTACGLHPALWSHLPGHAAAGDLDGDGDPDLVLLYRPDRNARPQRGPVEVWRNEPGPAGPLFVPAGPALGRTGEEVPEAGLLEDFDNDGRLDLYVVLNARGGAHLANRLYLGNGDGSFREQPAPWETNEPAGRAESALAADLDRDGDLDILACNGGGIEPAAGGGLVLHENRTARGGVTVALAAAAGPAHGLGARLELVAAGRTQVRQMQATASPFCASAPRAHFGTGGERGPFRLTVRWPSGREQTVALPRARAAYLVREGIAAPLRLPAERPEEGDGR